MTYGMIAFFLMFLFVMHSMFFDKNISNPLSMFLLMFSIITFLSGLRLYDLYAFDEEIYYIVLVGCLSFAVGYNILRFAKADIRIGHRSLGKTRINERLTKSITLLLFVFYLLIALRILSSISSGNYTFATIKMLYADGDEETKASIIYGSGLIKTIDLLVMRSLMYAVTVVTMVRFFKYKKVDFQVITAILAVVCYILTNYSRIFLIVLAVQICACALLFGGISKDTAKRIKKIVLRYVFPFVAVVGASIYIISIVRKKDVSKAIPFVEEMYIYFSSSMPLFAHYKAVADAGDILTFGMMFGKGFINFIMTFVGKLGIRLPLYDYSTEIVNATQQFIYLSPRQTSNAFTTMFYYFYLDFRMVGVVCYSGVFGGVMGYFYRKVRHFRDSLNERQIATYLLLLQALVKSFIRWEFVQMSYAMSFIFLLVFFTRADNTTKEGELR